MIDKDFVISEFKKGKTSLEIAKEMHVSQHSVSSIIKSKNFPSQKVVIKLLNDPDFVCFFTNLYNSTDDFSVIKEECLKHPFFKRITKISISNRIQEIRSFLDLPPKMIERVYENEYDRIRGYIIRNSKYMAKRRGIYFNLEYTDFELPEFCPILGIKLEYGSGNDGNSPNHATLDRIDNTKGYIPGNVMIISRLANSMKNSATFEQLQSFIDNYSLLLNHFNSQGTLGNITDIFPHWKKLSLDS